MAFLNPDKQYNFTSAPGGIYLPDLNKYLYLQEDLSLSASNTYEDPLQKIKDVMNSSPIGQTINQLSALFNVAVAATGFRLQTRFSALEAWTQSSKLRFSTKFSFNMGSHGYYSGFIEVYSPIEKLGAICLPSVTGPGLMLGPGPSFTTLMTAFASDFFNNFKGQTSQIKKATDAAAKTADETKTETRATVVAGAGVPPPISTEKQKALDTAATLDKATKLSENLKNPQDEKGVNQDLFAEKNRMIHFKIGPKGKLFDSTTYPGGFLPKEFSYTFSKELDSVGYPISGTATISWESFVMATGSGSFGNGGL